MHLDGNTLTLDTPAGPQAIDLTAALRVRMYNRILNRDYEVREFVVGSVLPLADGLEVRLVNEHRHVLTPDLDLDWDEVLVDRLLWRWSPREDLTVSMGRQDIIWPGGFLVLEGHPLDGSRTIFHDGVRLQAELGWGRLDAAVVHNQQRADLVLIDDLHRDLTLGEETGFLARVARGDWSGAFIVKDSDGAGDLRTWTWSGRYHGPLAGWGDLEAELAVQRQDGRVATVTPDGMTPRGDGWALAGQAFLARPSMAMRL